jgi:3-oxoadipate CoA-transferase, beta subunit
VSDRGWSDGEIAQMISDDLPAGGFVNLGIGLPNLVAAVERGRSDLLYHAENGVLGVGPPATEENLVPELIDAGKNPITITAGASFFSHVDSFSMIRSGKIDVSVMGAYQVSEQGDLANWWTGDPNSIPGVGGAMDLAFGAREVWVLCRHNSRNGDHKLVERCTYPLTGVGCVTRAYTDLAVLDIGDGRMTVDRLAPGVSLGELREMTGCHVHDRSMSGAQA